MLEGFQFLKLQKLLVSNESFGRQKWSFLFEKSCWRQVRDVDDAFDRFIKNFW